MDRIRTYAELIELKTFSERYEYLRLYGSVGVETFGFDRHLNQYLYKSPLWLETRDKVIVRDLGRDLGIEGLDIESGIIVHHMNPLTIEDIINFNPDIFNLEYLICTTITTHNGIHYGKDSIETNMFIERKPGDTKLW